VLPQQIRDSRPPPLLQSQQHPVSEPHEAIKDPQQPKPTVNPEPPLQNSVERKSQDENSISKINISPKLSEKQRAELNALLQEFSHLFVSDIRNLTPSNVEPFNIDTGTERPVKVPPRRVPPAHRLEIEKQLKDWKAAGLITESNSP
jgi:hypothetical protein